MLLNCGARGLLRVPWTARRSNQSILKAINPEYSLEGLMLKLRFQSFGHLMQRADLLEKTLMVQKSRAVTLLMKVCLVKAISVSRSHVWMWKLDHKEGWVPKNYCFCTVVLEKTLGSFLDCKEITPVNPKGNQAWIFIERSDAEAEAPILQYLATWCEKQTH